MMEIDDDDVLRSVAAGNSMDYSLWPALLPRIVSRIEKIAHDEFPIPNLPPPAPVVPSSIPHHPPSDSSDTENFLPPLPSSPTNPPSTTSSQDTNKENTPIAPRTAPPLASAPPAPSAPASEPLPPGTLPVQITEMLIEITRTLTSTFPTNPPHTIQRLAELVLTPKHHYKSLPTYLHALDRVVHVTSGLNIYPLPPAIPDMATASGMLSNGVSDVVGPNPFATPGSDEALGGALLTPIPWLQPRGPESNALSPQPSTHTDSSTGSGSANGGSDDHETAPGESPELRTESTETIEGPNGMGSIETVTVTVNGVSSMGARGVGVTQGELLRQEQRAGVVPVSQLASHISSHHHAAAAAAAAQHRATSASSNNATAAEKVESGEVVGTVQGADEDEKPHARGPEEIGAEDMGPQREGASTTNYHIGGPSGTMEMQGIDVEAAVGRKATETHTTSPEPKPTDADADEDADAGKSGDKDVGTADVEMDDVELSRARSETPKREAEEVLEGERKKLKEDAAMDVTATSADGESSEQLRTEAESEDKADDSNADANEKKKPVQD